MKKKAGAGKIVMIVLLLAAVSLFAIFASGIKIGFFENYTYNFKINMLAISNYFDIKLSEPVREYLTDLPTPEPVTEDEVQEETEPVESKIEKAEDIPDVEFEDLAPEDSKVKSTPVAMESASTYSYSDYRDYMLCVNETSVMAYNDAGKSLWAIGIHMSKPILDVGGGYYMIAERGGRKIALFDGKKRIYEAEADGDIKTAAISDNGDVVVVSEKEFYKGAVIVINKKGDRVFSWNSGNYNIVDADIAAGSRRVAVSLLATDTGANSIVEIFDISSGEKEGEATFEGSLVFDVDFLGEVLNVFADNKIVGLSQKAKQLWEVDYSSRKLLHYRAENSGYKLAMVDDSNSSQLEILTARGKQKSLITANNMPDCMDIRSGRIAYNSDRDLIFSGLSGKHKKSHTCSRDIKDIYIINNNTVMVVYSSGLEFIKF